MEVVSQIMLVVFLYCQLRWRFLDKISQFGRNANKTGAMLVRS